MKNIVHILLLTIFIAGSSQLSAFQYLEGNKVPSANNNDLLTHGMFRPNGSTSVYFQLIQENMLRSSDPEMQEPAYLNLYEPDLNLIKSFALRLPVEEAQLNYWAGGLELVNSLVNDTLKQFLIYKFSVYDSAYVSQFTDEPWSVFVGVLDESGDSLFTVLSNFHGFETFDVNGEAKLAVNRACSKDTAFFGGGSWYTTDVYTGQVYDLSTGALELQMPHGIMYEGITFDEGQRRILGRNNNIAAAYEHLYKEYDLLLYNLDGSLYKTAVDSLSYYGIGEFYYLSSVGQYCMKEKYSNTIYSLPDYEELASGGIFFDSGGLAKLVDYNDTTVSIYNEDRSLYKSLAFEQDNMHSVVWADMYDIVSDDKIEIVRECPNGGLQIFTEDGDMIFENWDLKLVENNDFSGDKVVLRFPDENYGRLIATDMNDYDYFTSYYKVGNLPVIAQMGGTPGNDNIELLGLGEEGFIVLDTLELIDGRGAFVVGEGEYALRSQGKLQSETLRSLSTYFPGELLWENARIVSFTTDETDALTISIQTVDLSVSAGASGQIRGTIRLIDDEGGLRSAALPAYDLYLVASSDHSQVKSFTTNNEEGAFLFDRIPAGSYDVLLNVEGKAMTSVNTVVLSSDASIVENVDYEITGDGIVATMQSSIERVRPKAPGSYLIQQVNTLLISGIEGTIQVRIIDLSGRVLLNAQTNRGQVDVSGLQSGIYLLELQAGEQKQVLKFRKR